MRRRYNIEPTSGEDGHFDGTGYGNWSPGPWRKLVDKNLPWVFKLTPDTLYQVCAGRALLLALASLCLSLSVAVPSRLLICTKRASLRARHADLEAGISFDIHENLS